MTTNRDADPKNTHERLWKAVNALATGTGTLDERLDEARLALSPLKVDDFPSKHLGQAFASLKVDIDRTLNGEIDGTHVAQATVALYSGIVMRGAGFYDDEHFAEHFKEID